MNWNCLLIVRSLEAEHFGTLFPPLVQRCYTKLLLTRFVTLFSSRAGAGSSTFWLLQRGLKTEASLTAKLSSTLSAIDFQMFDFLQDSGPKHDGDNFMAKIQR